jgi:hypothetical protein
MKMALVFAAVIEVATGAALLIVPSLVGQLLFGVGLTGIGMTVARVTGIALIALGVACWPGTPLIGMLTYSAAVTLYLSYLGIVGGLTGILLWPAIVVHAILTALAGAFGEGTQRDSINAMQAVMTHPRTVLKALELCARLNGELDSSHRMSPLKRPGPQGRVARSAR